MFTPAYDVNVVPNNRYINEDSNSSTTQLNKRTILFGNNS